MIQSNALSWQPDHGIEGQLEEKETIMLPENMFINLLDADLQERILNGKELDIDVKNAMETLLQEGPTSLKNDLEDWTIEEVDGRKMIFYKGKNYTKNYNKMWSKCITTMKWLDTQENWKPTTWYVNTIGGQDFERS